KAAGLVGQQFQERLEVGGIEFLGRQELPIDRAELFFQFRDAACEEALDAGAGFGEHAAIGREARALDREHEALRRLRPPAREALRLLRAVIGAVYFDRGHMLAGIFQLALLAEPLGIERAAPRLERPTPDADANVSCVLGRHVQSSMDVRPEAISGRQDYAICLTNPVMSSADSSVSQRS